MKISGEYVLSVDHDRNSLTFFLYTLNKKVETSVKTYSSSATVP